MTWRVRTRAMSFARFGSLSAVALSMLFASGCAADAGAPAAENEADFAQEIKSKTDADVQAEIEAAAKGSNYTSETALFTLLCRRRGGGPARVRARWRVLRAFVKLLRRRRRGRGPGAIPARAAHGPSRRAARPRA